MGAGVGALLAVPAATAAVPLLLLRRLLWRRRRGSLRPRLVGDAVGARRGSRRRRPGRREGSRVGAGGCRRGGGRAAARVAGGEGSVNGAGAKMLQPPFLKTKIRHRPFIGRVRHEGEVGGGVAEVLVESGGEGGEKKLVANLEADVVELVGEGLETHAEVVDGGVVLVTTEELLLQEDDPLKLVVGEEPDDLVPHRACIILVANNGVEDVLGHGKEEPPDDGGVDRPPVGVVVLDEQVGGAVNVILEIILTKEEVKVRLPRIEIGLFVRKRDRNTTLDGHIADVRRIGDGGGGAGGGKGVGGVGAVGEIGLRHGGGGEVKW